MRAATHTPLTGSTGSIHWLLCAALALTLGLSARVAVAEPDGERSQSPPRASPEVVEGGLCPASSYGKNLLITQFSRRNLVSANAGYLHQVESQVPRLIGAHLYSHPAIADTQLLPARLSDDTSAPRRAQQVRKLAHAQGVQLVLSGEIIDMSMAKLRDSYAPSLASRARNGLATAVRLRRLDTRQREFVFQLTLHDGITGAVLHQRQYHSRGVWAPGRPHQVGFGSPRFWRTDYGQKVADALALASVELAHEVSCLPLVASLDLKAGPEQVIVHSGADQQLGTGDTLRLFQVVTSSIPGTYQLHRTHLVDSQIDLEIQELHNAYSLGQLHGDLDLRHGRYVALSTQATQPADGVAARSH